MSYRYCKGEIVKQVSLTKFRQMTAEEIRESPCMELVADGVHVCYMIIGSEAEMRVRMQSHASMIDAARGKA